MPAVGKSWFAQADATGKLLPGAIPDAAVTEAELAQVLTSYGRDRGTGSALPTADLRRGDVYQHTGWGCLFVYNGTAWRQVHTPTIATYAARNTLTTAGDALYTGLRIFLTADPGEQVWNGSFWTPVHKLPTIRVIRTSSTGYTAASTFLPVPWDGFDATQSSPNWDEWFSYNFQVFAAERRITILRGGVYSFESELATTQGNNAIRITNMAAANAYVASDGGIASAAAPGSNRVTCTKRITAGEKLAVVVQQPGSDVADGANGYRSHFIITRLGD